MRDADARMGGLRGVGAARLDDKVLKVGKVFKVLKVGGKRGTGNDKR